LFQSVDRLGYQLGTIVGRDDLDALGQRRFQLVQLFFYSLDDVQCIFTGAHDDDAADSVAIAVQVSDAAANVPSPGDEAQVLHQNRRSRSVAADDDILDVTDAVDVAAAPDHVLRAAELEEAAAHVVVAVPNRLHHRRQGDVVSVQGIRVDVDLIL